MAGIVVLKLYCTRNALTQMTPKKSKLLHVYHVLVSEGSLAADEKLQRCLVKKSGKSESGVLVITVGSLHLRVYR